MSSVRWNTAVSDETDQSVRTDLAGEGAGRKEDFSRFIEEAVRAHSLGLGRRFASTRAHRISPNRHAKSILHVSTLRSGTTSARADAGVALTSPCHILARR